MTAVAFSERLKTCEYLLTDTGRADLSGVIRDYMRAHGPRWLAELKKAEPDLCTIVDLCANHPFADALIELDARVEEWIAEDPSSVMQVVYRGMKAATLRSYAPQLETLHAMIRAEIDKPRG
jgi:hypothetical protein